MPFEMSFGEALLRVVAGLKVTRRSWLVPDYVFLQAGVVHIKNEDGIHQLSVNDGDIVATDWVVVESSH